VTYNKADKSRQCLCPERVAEVGQGLVLWTAPKWFTGSSPKASTAYDIISAMTDLSIFPNVDSEEINLHAFARV
jgi:hypothetical protein